MRETVSLITAAAAFPVSRDELKTYLRITGDDENDILDDFIAAATDVVETHLRKSLITRTYRLTLDGLPYGVNNEWLDGVREGAISDYQGHKNYILLPKSPIQSITSVVYYTAADSAVTWDVANYRLEIAQERLSLKNGAAWPSDLRSSAAIEVTYVAGYGDTSASVPAAICMAIRMLAAQLYESRGCDCNLTAGVKGALEMYRRIDRMGNI